MAKAKITKTNFAVTRNGLFARGRYLSYVSRHWCLPVTRSKLIKNDGAQLRRCSCNRGVGVSEFPTRSVLWPRNVVGRSNDCDPPFTIAPTMVSRKFVYLWSRSYLIGPNLSLRQDCWATVAGHMTFCSVCQKKLRHIKAPTVVKRWKLRKKFAVHGAVCCHLRISTQPVTCRIRATRADK